MSGQRGVNRLEVDFDRTACLCDSDGHAFFAAVVIDGDGEETLWLVHRPSLNVPGADHGNPYPTHELVGRLPGVIHQRVWGEGTRCGRPTGLGRPCRNRVTEPGQACGLHRPRRL